MFQNNKITDDDISYSVLRTGELKMNEVASSVEPEVNTYPNIVTGES
jgi:hypothetical protein